MFDILLFVLLGLGIGIVTGLVPGLHVNTVALMILGTTLVSAPYYAAVIIVSVAVTHTIFDFIPSIFLGAPEPSTALSVLPGHRLLLQGRGLEAVYLTALGGLGGMVASFIFLPLLLAVIPAAYNSVNSYIHLILIGIAMVMVFSEKRAAGKAAGFVVFILSGGLGLIMLNSPLLHPSFVLFPIFTGLFGMSNLLISLNKKTRIPKQKKSLRKVPRRLAMSGIFKGLVSGTILGVLPGVGAAEATVLTQQATRKKDHREFLISVGAINTVVTLFSLIALYTISKPRSGAAVAVGGLVEPFGFIEMLLFFGVAMIITGLSVLILLKIFRRIMPLLERINYAKLTLSVIIFLIILVFAFTGSMGLLVLGVSTAIGLLPPLFGVKRSLCMGCLMVPLVFFYAGFLILF